MERSSETSAPHDTDPVTPEAEAGPAAGIPPTPSERQERLQERLWGLGESAQPVPRGKPLFRSVPPPMRSVQEETDDPRSDEIALESSALASTVGTLARQLERSVRRLLVLETRVTEGLAALDRRVEERPLAGGSAPDAAHLAARLDAVEDMVAGAPAPSATAERALARADELDRRLGELEKAHGALNATVERSSREVLNRLTRRIEDLRDDVSVQIAEARRTAAARPPEPDVSIPPLVERLKAAEHVFAERARAVAQGLAETATGPAVAHLHAFRGAVTELLGLHREVRQTVEALNPPPAPAPKPEP